MEQSLVFWVSHAAGGVRAITMDLAEGLIERGWSVRLMGLYPVPIREEDRVKGLDWDYLVDEKPRGLIAKLRMILRLIRWLRHAPAPIMVTTMPAVSVLLPALARIFRPKAHFVIIHHVPVQVYHRWLDRMDGLIGRMASVKAVISVSKAADASLHAKAPAYRAKCRVITNALPRVLQDQLSAMRGAGRREGAPARIVASGRLTAQKNLPMLLNAMADVEGATLDLIGSGEDEAALQQQVARLGIGDRVRFLGHLPRPDALAAMARGDIFVQVSLYEGHSIALLEAAALGMPIIVSDVPSQVEGVGMADGTAAGIIVPVDAPQNLALHINAIVSDEAAYSRWQQLSVALAEQHGFDAMAERYHRLFQALRQHGKVDN
jgi:glycosyltransferase involved in cell wall biosynthesis